MFETFRSIRFHLLLAALGYIAVGAVMLFIPDQFLAVVCYVIGALLIAYGVIGMLMCWKDRTIRMVFWPSPSVFSSLHSPRHLLLCCLLFSV